MKKLLAILSVVLFANQASADEIKVGDVYYCNSTVTAGLGETFDLSKNQSIKSFEPENLRFKITNGAFTLKDDEFASITMIEFGKTGFFANETMLAEIKKPSLLTAQSAWATFLLQTDDEVGGTVFTFASANPWRLILIAGSCDKF